MDVSKLDVQNSNLCSALSLDVFIQTSTLNVKKGHLKNVPSQYVLKITLSEGQPVSSCENVADGPQKEHQAAKEI